MSVDSNGGKCRCPNCGVVGEPHQIVRCAEKITFYLCPDNCGFSTWHRWEFIW